MDTPIFHFTHINNLSGIIQKGLLAENYISQTYYVNIGDHAIKERRKRKSIVISGMQEENIHVGDCVPFYYAARSPMMYRQFKQGKINNSDIIYLISYAEYIFRKYICYISNKNAACETAFFYNTLQDLYNNIDWNIIRDTNWKSTNEHPDKMQRKMAEFLVYRRVLWGDIKWIVVFDNNTKNIIGHIKDKKILVRPDLYFG